jgi:hypothetical protein
MTQQTQKRSAGRARPRAPAARTLRPDDHRARARALLEHETLDETAVYVAAHDAATAD